MNQVAPLAVFLAAERDEPAIQQLIDEAADYSIKLWDGAWLFLTDTNETSLEWWAEQLKALTVERRDRFLLTSYEPGAGELGSAAVAWLWEMGYGPEVADSSGDPHPG
jgi:hypothetical protein